MNGSQKDVWGPALGPWQNMMQSMLGKLDDTTQNSEPMVKGMARLNLEAVALATRRAQAYLEVPSRLGRCRTPQDLVGEQMRFWQTAYEQYSDCARKAMTIWGSMTPGIPSFGQGGRNGAARERDFITFPEPREVASERRPAGARRAA